MLRLILSFLGLNLATLDQMRRFHARWIATGMLLLLGLIVVGLTFNYFGLKEVNFFISLFLTLAAIILATRPEPLLAAIAGGIVSGVIKEPETIRNEVTRFFKGYMEKVGYALLWISIFALFMGFIPIRENPWAVMTIATALIIIGFASKLWRKDPVIYQKVIYWYACFVFILSLFSLVTGATYIKYFGFNPKTLLEASDTENSVYEAETAVAKAQEKANVKILKAITKKVKAGTELSESEKDFLRTMQIERDNNTLISRGKEKMSEMSSRSFSSGASAYASPAPAPVAMTVVYTPPPVPAPIPTVNISGDWDFNWGDPGTTGFRISQIGNSLSGKSNFHPGEMILKGSVNGTSAEGTWELIGHPAGHLKGRFCIASLTDSAGNGTWTHNDGHTTHLIINR